MFKDLYKAANDSIKDEELKNKILHGSARKTASKKPFFLPAYSYGTAAAAVLALVIFFSNRFATPTDKPHVTAMKDNPIAEEFNDTTLSGGADFKESVQTPEKNTANSAKNRAVTEKLQNESVNTDSVPQQNENNDVREFNTMPEQEYKNGASDSGTEMLNSDYAVSTDSTDEQYSVMTARAGDFRIRQGFEDSLISRMDGKKSYVISPFSAKAMLAMAANGAEGETKEQILTALGIDNLEDFNIRFSNLLKTYAKSDVLVINSSNSIWLNNDQTTSKFSENFEKTAKDFYDADSKTVNNENAVSSVNSWVTDSTNSKITSLISDNDFAALLVNAVYFKASFADGFDKNLTHKDAFICADGQQVQKDFMTKTDYLMYGEINGTQLVRLDYINPENSGFDISLYLLMGENKVENPIELINTSTLNKTYIKLSMPVFEFEYSSSMKELLKTMGVYDAFEENADFSSLTDSEKLYLSDVIQKTYIKTNEDGTEAAAATAGIFALTSANMKKPFELTLNKQFTFVVFDNINNETLFAGEIR